MREIRLNGYIDDEAWFGDEITPAGISESLYPPDADTSEDVRIILNSYGGSCNAATQIYDIIRGYPGNVQIVVSGTAASAATVVAMAADRLEITPGSLFMCHDPMMAAYGNDADLEAAQEMLRVCKESIINIYQQRSWHGRDDLAEMMRATTWMDANTALREGFVDAVLTEKDVFGILNAAEQHIVSIEDAKKRFENWIDRHKPMKRSLRDTADAAETSAASTSDDTAETVEITITAVSEDADETAETTITTVAETVDETAPTLPVPDSPVPDSPVPDVIEPEPVTKTTTRASDLLSRLQRLKYTY